MYCGNSKEAGVAEGKVEMSLRGGGRSDSVEVEFTSSKTYQAGTRPGAVGAQRGLESPRLTVAAL